MKGGVILTTFTYTNKEIEYLKKKDPHLGKAMDLIGPIKRRVYDDVFTTLVHAIIGQLISTQAQEAIWLRFSKAFNPITAQNISKIDVDALKTVGLTHRKAIYIHEIAQKIVDGTFNIDELETLDDQEVIEKLTQLKGVGIWTAEMVLIFAFQRPNVISYKDVAIIRGLKMLYNKEEITQEFFNEIKLRYTPFASVASLYLWEISKNNHDLNKIT